MARVLALFVALALIGLFAAVNWAAFNALTPLSLGVTTVQAPLGLIMLGLIAFLCVLFAVWVIVLQANSLRDARRQTKALQQQRDLADRAEASRFTELRAELMARLDRLQLESRQVAEQHSNAVAAQIGELEDRMQRSALPPPR
jgi:hypothetical protein